VYAAYLQTIGRWFQEFSDEQKNLILLQLLVGNLFMSVFTLFLMCTNQNCEVFSKQFKTYFFTLAFNVH